MPQNTLLSRSLIVVPQPFPFNDKIKALNPTPIAFDYLSIGIASGIRRSDLKFFEVDGAVAGGGFRSKRDEGFDFGEDPAGCIHIDPFSH